MIVIPSRLQQARKWAGLSTGQVQAKLGIDKRELEALEEGKLEASDRVINLLAELYDSNLIWLQGKDEELDVDPQLVAMLDTMKNQDDAKRLFDLLISLRRD